MNEKQKRYGRTLQSVMLQLSAVAHAEEVSPLRFFAIDRS